MRLDPSSWHYRIWKTKFRGGRRLPATVGICDYVGAVVHGMVKAVVETISCIILALGIAFIAGVGIALFGYALLSIGAEMAHQPYGHPLHPEPATVFFTFVIVVSFAGLVVGMAVLRRALQAPGMQNAKMLVTEYLKARKERVCPMLEVPEAGETVE